MSKKPEPVEDDDNDDYIGSTRSLPPLIPPGNEYLAVFEERQSGEYMGLPREWLWFRITSPEQYQHVSLYLPCAHPKHGGSFAPSSKMGQAVTVALGHYPGREEGYRIRDRHFKNKTFRIAVRTVTRVAKVTDDGERADKNPNDFYSVISHLIARVEPETKEGGTTE